MLHIQTTGLLLLFKVKLYAREDAHKCKGKEIIGEMYKFLGNSFYVKNNWTNHKLSQKIICNENSMN